MSHEKKQYSTEELLQQLKKSYPQLAEELTEVLKRHGLAEMFEVEIRLTKKSMEEDSKTERDFRIIPRPLLLICIRDATTGLFKCIP